MIFIFFRILYTGMCLLIIIDICEVTKMQAEVSRIFIMLKQSIGMCSCWFADEYLEMSVGCRDPQTNETCRGPQELSPHLFALCFLQDPREAHLHPYRAHCRPASSSGASWVPTGEVHSRPNCSTYPTHRGLI